jgi:hypothetical protein
VPEVAIAKAALCVSASLGNFAPPVLGRDCRDADRTPGPDPPPIPALDDTEDPDKRVLGDFGGNTAENLMLL